MQKSKKVLRYLSAIILSLTIISAGNISMAETNVLMDQEEKLEIRNPELEESTFSNEPELLNEITIRESEQAIEPNNTKNENNLVKDSEGNFSSNQIEKDELKEEASSEETISLKSKQKEISGYIKYDVIFREKPSGKQIGKIPAGTEVIGKEIGAWAEVSYDGKTGYIAKSFIVDAKEISGHIKYDVIFREKPSGKQIGKIPAGTEVIGKEIGAWAEVSYDGRTGYIAKSFIGDNKRISGYIQYDVIFREEPSGKQIGKIPAGTKVIGKEVGAWAEVSYDGRTGYIAKSFIGDNKRISGYIQYDVIFREEPSGKQIGKIPAGIKLSGKEVGAWAEVSYDGKTGYIAKHFVKSNQLKYKGFTKTKSDLLNSKGTKISTIDKGIYIEGYHNQKTNRIKITQFGKTYYIDLNQTKPLWDNQIGWISHSNNKYFVSKGKNVARGWKLIGGSRYYFDPMHRFMYTGVKNTGEGVYHFSNQGKLRVGTYTVNGSTYNHKIYLGAPKNYEYKNAWLRENERHFIGQHITNRALEGIGTKFEWYGTNLEKGVYCSGVAYRAYKDYGITIPGPEYGKNTNDGYRMVHEQYTNYKNYGGKRFTVDRRSYSNLKPGDLFFAKAPHINQPATHTMIYAGVNSGRPMTIHAGIPNGLILEPVSIVPNHWGYGVSKYGVRYY